MEHSSALLLPLTMLFLLAGSSAAFPAQQPGMDRLRRQFDRVNRRGPALGLVMSYADEATALQSSGYFLPWPVLPFIDLYGRRFHIGSIRGVDVIYALTGQRRLNAAVTVQTLIDVFTVSGIVHYGTAGSSNDSLSFGDVSIPKLVAYTGAWTWKVPFLTVIVFRGVSDLAGGESTWSSTSLMNLASINALKVAVEFIATVGNQKSTVSAERSNY